MAPLPWVYDDGGRADSGRHGTTGDCVTRAIAIATGESYVDVYREIADLQGRRGIGRTARSFRLGRRTIDALLAPRGFAWTPTMMIGSGCTVHLAEGELPAVDVLVVRLTGHITAVLDGVVHDTYDPGRDGTRCVYGYWRKP